MSLLSCLHIDLVRLTPNNVVTAGDGKKWIKFSRKKTATSVGIPLLKPALTIMEWFTSEKEAAMRETLFPLVTNQEMNKSIKVIGKICGIRKNLTFHIARHTFATTVTLLNGVPIETISKMLGHTKITTTMIYSRVTQSKIGSDMTLLQNKIENTSRRTSLGLTD